MTPHKKILAATAAMALLACGLSVQAQVYRSVGPDGKVTFSDRAPENSSQAASAGSSGTGGAGGAENLPYALRQVATRYPVTLYTGDDCTPCVSARNLLINRGVPFTERTVNTNDDVEAFKRLSGGNTLPFGSIGGQQLNGFADTEWTQYLDAAGYPKQSQLPSNYRRPAATPLVAAVERPAATPAAPAPRPATPAAPSAPAPAPSNPAGIVF